MEELVYEVDADVVDEEGGSDGAYDLDGSFTPEEFCQQLLLVLKEGFDMTNAKGEVTLKLSIKLRNVS